ncbi:MAG: TIGR02466 family protein [Pseudomonadota bacterium]
MADLKSLFVTPLYHAALTQGPDRIDIPALEASCWSIAQDDEAGQKWSEENGYPGYTSYASLSDLGWRSPTFAELITLLDAHVATFAQELSFDLDGRALKLEDIWINILPEGGIHTGHLHPHSVISGTTYVALPDGSASIKFEDPRLPMMMAAPGRVKDAPETLRPFVYVTPKVGDVLLWESWLRHEVPMNMAERERISVSFNYSWR